MRALLPSCFSCSSLRDRRCLGVMSSPDWARLHGGTVLGHPGVQGARDLPGSHGRQSPVLDPEAWLAGPNPESRAGGALPDHAALGAEPCAEVQCSPPTLSHRHSSPPGAAAAGGRRAQAPSSPHQLYCGDGETEARSLQVGLHTQPREPPEPHVPHTQLTTHHLPVCQGTAFGDLERRA